MTNIERMNYGFKLTFAGAINQEEMASWVEESRNVLINQNSQFGVVVDMRDLSPLSSGAKDNMLEGQRLYKEKGMTRSAVIVDQGFLAVQFKLIAEETGIYQWERYIDSSSIQNWENIAIDWIVNNIDPDKD